MQAIQTFLAQTGSRRLFELQQLPQNNLPLEELRAHVFTFLPWHDLSVRLSFPWFLPKLNSVSCNQPVWRAGANTAPLLDVSSHCPTRTVTTRKQEGFLNSPKHHARLEATREGIFSTPPSRRLKIGARLTLHS